MTTQDLKDFLTEKKGYAKKGSGRLAEILRAKGFDITNLTQEDFKAVLRELARKTAKQPKKKKKPVPTKILIYDIETSLVEAQLWGSGKQYVGHDSIITETQIITVAYKWLGDSEVHYLKWNKKKSDKKLIKKFAKIYNQADMVVGWNNNSFDNKIVQARAMKYGIEINTFVKSFDIMRQVKKVFRLPSYSMAYVSKYLGLSGKFDYSLGIRMWKDIQWGGPVEASKAMLLMIKYNVQDVVLTEEIYLKIRKYLGNQIHVGALSGKNKATTCPNCSKDHSKLYKTTVTAAGTIQRIMKCKSCKVKYKLSNTAYLKNY